MKQQKIDILITKLFKSELTKNEAKVLEKWLIDESHLAYFNKFVAINHLLNTKEKFNYRQSLEQIKKQRLKANKKRRQNGVLKYAAIIIVLFGIGYLLFQSKQPIPPINKIVNKEASPTIIDNAITSGKSQAVLTLADGVQVILNKEKKYKQEHVRSTGEGLVYGQASAEKKELKYNYLTVPRGGQFSILLSDSTIVWLNSDSKLKYPVEFIEGRPRQVELLYGEAYFEVSPSEQHNGDLFVAIVNNIEIKALGTAFNIKAYQDENNIYTTLAEGKVELTTPVSKVTLKPYQQATTHPNHENITVETLSSLNELLWRKGEFSFRRKPLKDIMKVLSRWYDMEVIFNSPEVENIEFTGVLGKEQSIEEIMIIIRRTNSINYEINHKTLTIE